MNNPRLLRQWWRSTTLLALGGLFSVAAQVAGLSAPAVRVASVQSNGWVHISGDGITNAVITLSASSNLMHWQTIAVLHGGSFDFADPISARLPHRFYRFSALPLSPTNDWKNQIQLLPMIDPFFYRGDWAWSSSELWVKFAILTNEPARVYYADGSKFLLHYDFAAARLEPVMGLDPARFDDISLYNDGRQVILGAVLVARRDSLPEYGIQFVARDPLPREMVRDLFELVKSTIVTAGSFRAFYIPTFEQTHVAEADRMWFESNGIEITSTARWISENTCYALGWALGTVKFFPASEITGAYADGRLLPQDILLTDGVPSELPYVAGIITLAPSTPNSHVAILARSYGVPFVHLHETTDRERVLELVGRDIILQLFNAQDELARCTVDIDVLDLNFNPALKAEIIALKNAAPINITSKAHFGAYTASTDNLVPSDIRFFGGKAANYGLLRRTIPNHAPIAIGISFDLWAEFMAQALATGKTLRQEIADRLAGYRYPADIPAIKTALNPIRTLIRQNTQFTATQQQAIVAALSIFDSRRNIRFRSSTNVEDTEAFTGAGLYDSYSGCLDDDLDGDNRGPSHCDPTETDERGVFRAIRRVYASFYNDNAYLERLRRGVDEELVGMAILVHHSTPDDIEMANGVATVVRETSYATGNLVTQLGATSVANPDGSATPEVVEAFLWSTNNPPSLTLWQGSSLVPLGDHVMGWESDYRTLAGLLFSVSEAYGRMTGKTGKFVLDFEYKKVAPAGWLEVKQVREIPLSDTNDVTVRYFINDPMVLVSHQGVLPLQGGDFDIFGTHRLKSRWNVETRNLRFTEANFSSTLYTDLRIEHLNGDRVETLAGPIQTFPDFSSTVNLTNQFILYDRWRMSSRAGPAAIELKTRLPSSFLVPSRDKRFVTLREAWLELKANYDYPVPFVSGSGGAFRNSDSVLLRVARRPGSMPQDSQGTRTFGFTDGGTNVSISITYTRGSYTLYGDTRSLVGPMETRIQGLTTVPIVLTNFYSQTMAMYHLGGGDVFLFEPRLEPGFSPSLLTELEALDVRLLHCSQSYFGGTKLLLMRRDGTFRSFGQSAP